MTNLRVVRSGPRENAGDYSFEEVEYHRSSSGSRQEEEEEAEVSVISKLLSNALVHAVDGLLTAFLSPLTMWRWLSQHEHLMLILKVVFEVVLELIMLIVFAGVSILTAAVLIFDDVYNNDASHSTSRPKAVREEEATDEIPIANRTDRKTQEKSLKRNPVSDFRK